MYYVAKYMFTVNNKKNIGWKHFGKQLVQGFDEEITIPP